MGPILIVAWLLLLPLVVFGGGLFVVSLLVGHAFSTGDDGDPPPEFRD